MGYGAPFLYLRMFHMCISLSPVCMPDSKILNKQFLNIKLLYQVETTYSTIFTSLSQQLGFGVTLLILLPTVLIQSSPNRKCLSKNAYLAINQWKVRTKILVSNFWLFKINPILLHTKSIIFHSISIDELRLGSLNLAGC